MGQNPLDLDLDLLAEQLQSEMTGRGFSLRAASTEIGCSPTTLSRLLLGSKAPNVPDSRTLLQAVSWVGKSIADFGKDRAPDTSTIAEVVLHLRALPELNKKDKEALVAIVKAMHDQYRLGTKKG